MAGRRIIIIGSGGGNRPAGFSAEYCADGFDVTNATDEVAGVLLVSDAGPEGGAETRLDPAQNVLLASGWLSGLPA